MAGRLRKIFNKSPIFLPFYWQITGWTVTYYGKAVDNDNISLALIQVNVKVKDTFSYL